MRYIPHTDKDIERLLHTVGADSVDELFSVIPQELRLRGGLDLPGPLCEADLLEHLADLAALNRSAGSGKDLVFAGAGLYPHAIPCAVETLSGRSEFYTAYTPYQPELSQGTLLAIFEFQTMVAELMGLDMANASMYDGASATAEAILMARRITRRQRCVLAAGLHPEYAQTCATYLKGMDPSGSSLTTVGCDESGRLNPGSLQQALDDTVAAVVIQSPNFFGVLEDLSPLCEAAHQAGALVIGVCTEPLALALIKPPGECGADIAVGEGIGLAGPPNLGGPGVGLMAASGKKAMRAMPGRFVGQTVDSRGNTGYVLTLSTREQHIRRERATSNICTNHGLFALRMTIHLALLGRSGFVELARLNLAKTQYAKDLLSSLDGYGLKYPKASTFNEFALRVPGGDASVVVGQAGRRGIVPGVALGRFLPEHKDTLLVSVNERHRREDIQRLAEILGAAS